MFTKYFDTYPNLQTGPLYKMMVKVLEHLICAQDGVCLLSSPPFSVNINSKYFNDCLTTINAQTEEESKIHSPKFSSVGTI